MNQQPPPPEYPPYGQYPQGYYPPYQYPPPGGSYPPQPYPPQAYPPAPYHPAGPVPYQPPPGYRPGAPAGASPGANATYGPEGFIPPGMTAGGDQPKNMQEWLFEAVTTRNVMLLRFVIQAGVDINAVDSQNDTAPLITAAKLCFNDILEMLLQNGANPNITDKKGWTAIHWASVMNNVQAVELLCKHGVDIYPRTHGGKSALDLAVLKNHKEVKDFLLKWSKDHGNPLREPSPTATAAATGEAGQFVFGGRDRSVRACLECKSTKTPQWRRGPGGAVNLCNACGLRYIKLNRKSTKESAQDH
eukprot:comp23555_c0_seq1/m.39780 comp23555_c0_seq1/g.39780  ORF comp23555_c0_seq1/g.39780 comp23555_c0_seq1/m.39780 type:complete len:303 (-) comp23555_c0_seq1:344-1252(-)